jgi:hypothetical protein
MDADRLQMRSSQATLHRGDRSAPWRQATLHRGDNDYLDLADFPDEEAMDVTEEQCTLLTSFEIVRQGVIEFC